MSAAEPVYFASAAEFRDWLTDNHTTATELVVGFYKRHTERANMTWSESVDEALCFGWIDGLRRRVDDDRYTIRFTPRRTSSTWSAVNIAKVADLEARGLMTEAGRAAFAARREDRSAIYSHEQRPRELPAEYRRVIEDAPTAAAHFDACPPSYRRAATWWVVSAKKEETRQRRIASIVEHHARGETIPALTRPGNR